MNGNRAKQYLKQGNFERLFVDELGWDCYDLILPLTIDGQPVQLRAVAEKRDVVAFHCAVADAMPPYATRGKIERQVAQRFREHLIIYTSGESEEQIWQWARRELGRPLTRREHKYNPRHQSGDSLIQKLETIAFSFAEEEDLTLVDVTSRVRAAFNVERATKKFYDLFKKDRDAFEKFIQGIPDVDMSKWYVSVMLNRLMFIYFIQRKGFLNGDRNYLRNRLQIMQERYGDDQFYSFYRYFLLRLFHDGLGKPDHDPELEALIGKVPYLNGGIFQLHQVEEKYPDIQISDDAFRRIFDFFDQYQWHLDDRPLRDDREINPDVLGYIFEKYINQKQMGAYYTKEDITGYISQNTIIPFLFDQAQKECAIAFGGAGSLWRLAQDNPDRYIYEAVRWGTELPLPPEIAVGLDDVSRRDLWNTPTPEEYGLPTEIWRETVARRQRYGELRDRLAAGEVTAINDFITYNLDIVQFAQDVIENCEGPELLRAFWKAIVRISVLDPTVGSGAFLFAALNILEPLYEAGLERMQAFVAELGPTDHPQKYSDFKQILARVQQHPNQKYFVLKSIVVNNLYGVDIMAEAVEIAKLRLFLKLVSQVETVEQIEPLPDIDFNIRAGNTLVGFTTPGEVAQAMQRTTTGQGRLLFAEDQTALARIEEKAGDVDRLFGRFREMQTSGEALEFAAADFVETKQHLQERLQELEAELNRYLAQQYGVNPDNENAYQKWLASHQPFHWFIEFYGILKQGGFDIIIGNPPYVEYRLVKKDYTLRADYFKSLASNNLYAYCMERSTHLISLNGRFGMIVPTSVIGLDRTDCLREILLEQFELNLCSTYGIRPSTLFDGVDQRLCIYLGKSGKPKSAIIQTTRHHYWYAEERPNLFNSLLYNPAFNHNRLLRFPQIPNTNGLQVLKKLENQSHQTIKQYFATSTTGYLMHYHRSPRYWIRSIDFEPHFRSATRTRSIHHFRDLYFRGLAESKVIGALLNSSLFYFWFISLGNGRNITGTDIEEFPVGKLTAEILLNTPPIFDSLMDDYKQNSIIRVRADQEYQEFYQSKSKSIIDEIDLILGRHYGFADEELDFIVNYDIKYRMGDELFEDNDEDES
ncbi:MAG: Eco57I restriction-modification methylase domain-containing protein [Anaerolinea sp.]|nr:Eco57I restriction-modification methylase domain-containing protein [Anaerolinea sp.]